MDRDEWIYTALATVGTLAFVLFLYAVIDTLVR